MIKTINTGVAELVLVKVPDDARNFKVSNDDLPCLSFSAYNTDTHRLYLSSGKYELLGIAHELSEDAWDTIVDKLPCLDSFPYKDYGYKDAGWDGFEWFYQTATESGLSLLRANGIYFDNPYQMPSHRIWQTDQIMYNRLERQYEQAQENTGKWVVLKNTNV